MSDSDLLKPWSGLSARDLLLYEDEDLLILNKPSGIPSVPQRLEDPDSMVRFYLDLNPQGEGVGRGGLEPGILHRLDTGTSGCLVFAKNQDAYQFVHQNWKTERTQKTYRALSRGGPDFSLPQQDQLPLRLALLIGHDLKSKRRMRVIEPHWNAHQVKTRVRGKPLEALTWIEAIQKARGEQWDITVRIETGVMHQIRAHLSHCGLPLVGDPIYGGAPGRRLGLHAWKVRLPHPRILDRSLDITAPLPQFWPEISPDF